MKIKKCVRLENYESVKQNKEPLLQNLETFSKFDKITSFIKNCNKKNHFSQN